MNNRTPALFRAFLAGGLVSLLLPSIVLAQQKRGGMEVLAKSSDVIALGKVTSLTSEWADNRSRIVTTVTLVVGEYLKKGNADGNVITISTPGGEIGDVGEMYTHMPTFRQNEEVVVFLEKAEKGHYRVAGGNQGKYNIEQDPATGQPLVAGKVTVREFSSAVKRALLE